MSILQTMARMPGLRDVAEAWRMAQSRRVTGFKMEARPGHFSSPIPALKDVKARETEIFSVPPSIPGLEMRDQEQLRLIAELARFYEDQPFSEQPTEDVRYYFDNSFFSYGDGLVLHALLRLMRPQRLIEIGSGFSSAVILDTADRFLPETLSCTFIDPFPRRLHALLREEDARRHRILASPIQAVPLEVFDELQDGDVLFIDSTHVAKVGSDVNRIVFEVLPRVGSGVIVHFHDIFYPFEYPREWVYRGRAWNEAYLLRALLMFNSDFEMVLFNSYLAQRHHDEVAELMPLWARNPGGSLWIRRT